MYCLLSRIFKKGCLSLLNLLDNHLFSLKRINGFVNYKMICTSVIIVFSCQIVMAQQEFKSIIPLSPNAAEMTRYGEIPVDYFTGVPNTTIPLYTIKSGSLELPLALSYHAGGNKVEALATWVGLAWSVGSLPVITRSVNGIPDEKAGGFFYSPSKGTVKQLYNELANGNDKNFAELLEGVKRGDTDTEPDVFYFSINGKNGRFFYDQDLQKFVVTPLANINIAYSSSGFIITSDDGTQYFFNDQESTAIAGAQPIQSSVVTSWMITKIVNASKTDEITFTYDIEHTVNRSVINVSKYQFVSGVSCLDIPDQTGSTIVDVFAKSLASISFKGGKVQFIKQAAMREDLNGGYALDQIKVLNGSNILIKQFGFNYKYLTGSGCNISNDIYKSNKWMLLNELKEISTDNLKNLTHTFQYNELNGPPCRTSPAQDYWGYYNGASSNINLIPTMPIPNSDVILPGANRDVVPAFTQFGILTKITYPTGGYTDFSYENNNANNNSSDLGLVGTYKNEMAYVADESWEELPVNKEYDTTFVINNPKDLRLNNNNPRGGAFVTGKIDRLGVRPGDRGAVIFIQGLSSDNSDVKFYPIASFDRYFLPNGTYRLKAVFSQDPPAYQGFSCVLNWEKIDSSLVNNYAGGLRIKQIRSYANGNTTPISKNFSYVTTLGSDTSSGQVFIKPRFKYYDLVNRVTFYNYYCEARYMRIRSYSNQTQVTHSGSYIGYKKIFIQSDMPSLSGLTSYEYTHLPDVDYNVFPYPPAQSMESFRGQVKEINEYRYENNQYVLAKRSSFEYKTIILENEAVFGLKTSTELIDTFQYPNFTSYDILKSWSALAKKTERTYSGNNASQYVETVNEYEYDSPYNQLTYTTTKNTKGEILKTQNFYPYNLTLTGAAETARQWLIANNNVSSVLKEETNLSTRKIKTVTTDFKNFDGVNLVKINAISQVFGNSNDWTRQIFDRFDTNGNLLEVHKENGPRINYIWSYNKQYPVAEIRNTDYATIESILGASEIDVFSSTNPDKAAIDKFLAVLKTKLPEAEVTSYSYDPLIGMRTQTDAKGQITYYEYDEFQRLKNVKDQQGNIIKSNNYNYKN